MHLLYPKRRIHLIENKEQHSKYLTYIINIIGLGKWRNEYKFFGGGEVLTDERSFPHDGWNILLLFWQNIWKKNYTLLGGIATPRKSMTKWLYSILLPRAQRIVVRDHISQKLAPNSELYQDFAIDIIKNTPLLSWKEKPYILINTNRAFYSKALPDILEFCKQHPEKEKIFVPCDMNDDIYCFSRLKRQIPKLHLWNWTEHSLQKNLTLFANAHAGIGARLHFLLPLKLYKRPFKALVYAEKIKKIIL